MPHDPGRETLQALAAAVTALREAQACWARGLERLPPASAANEVERASALVDELTHDSASVLELGMADLETLIRRLELRRAYPELEAEFDRIVCSEWSLELVQELHRAHPELPAHQISAAVRELIAAWHALPRLAGGGDA